MQKTHFYALAGASITTGAVAALFVAPLFYGTALADTRIMPMWANNYATLGEMVSDVDAVVIANVGASRAGRTVVTASGAGLPFTLVDLSIERVVRGEADEFITLERTGGLDDDSGSFFGSDGGHYYAGDRMLLFLKVQPETGFYYLAHPKGRFYVDGDEVVSATAADDPVAQVLARRTVDQAEEVILSAGIGRRPITKE